MTCQICLESFELDKLYKVGCNSSVDHLICYECEGNWRSMIRDSNGSRTAICPTCRQPEVERSLDSIQREVNRYSVTITVDIEVSQPPFTRCFMCIALFFPLFIFIPYVILVDGSFTGVY
jgi:hypothetical protein